MITDDYIRAAELRQKTASWASFMEVEGKDPVLARATIGLVGSRRKFELSFADLRDAFEALFQVRRIILYGSETEKALRSLMEFFGEERCRSMSTNAASAEPGSR
jgi:hypothetical protein